MLVLPIKKKWYDMILSGEKKEEYRDIKEYYKTRFTSVFGFRFMYGVDEECTAKEIIFRNGYSTESPSFIALCKLRKGEGKTEWGAEEGKRYYILEIMEIRKKDRKEDAHGSSTYTTTAGCDEGI